MTFLLKVEEVRIARPLSKTYPRYALEVVQVINVKLSGCTFPSPIGTSVSISALSTTVKGRRASSGREENSSSLGGATTDFVNNCVCTL